MSRGAVTALTKTAWQDMKRGGINDQGAEMLVQGIFVQAAEDYQDEKWHDDVVMWLTSGRADKLLGHTGLTGETVLGAMRRAMDGNNAKAFFYCNTAKRKGSDL